MAAAMLGVWVPLVPSASAATCFTPDVPTLEVTGIAPDDPDGGLSIHADPSDEARILYLAAPGETLTSLGECVLVGSSEWWAVSVGDVRGWANANFVAPPATVPPTVTTQAPPDIEEEPTEESVQDREPTEEQQEPADEEPEEREEPADEEPEEREEPTDEDPVEEDDRSEVDEEEIDDDEITEVAITEDEDGSAAELGLGIGIGLAVSGVAFGLFQRFSPTSASSLGRFRLDDAVPARASTASQNNTPDQRGNRPRSQPTAGAAGDDTPQPDVIFVDLSPQPSGRYRSELPDS